jgi:quinol monooxygenase YgiN
MRIFLRLLLATLVVSALPHTLNAQDKPRTAAQPSPTMYVVSYIETAPGSQAQVATMLKQLADASRKEGPVRYEVLQRTEGMQRSGESNQFLILEIWKDQQALDRHNAAAPAKQFRQQIAPLLLAPIDERLCVATTVAPLREARGSVYVVTHVDLPPTDRDALVPLIREFAEQSRKDAGNIRFDVVHQQAKTNHFSVIGVWADQKSDEDHQEAAHKKAFRAKITLSAGALYDQRWYKPL